MFQFLFLDLDDTLLDFHKAESIAVAKAFQDQGLEPTLELIQRYSQVNKLHWEMLERGELTREQVLVQRFATLFRELGIPASPERCQSSYEHYLSIGHYFMDDAEELLQYLSPKYRLFIASNGTAKVQEARLKSAGIGHYFEQVFISQYLGVNKPDAAFFDACFSAIDGFDRSKAMIIGDSLTSDIRGGNNAGIRTCWFNPKGAAPRPGIHVDYEIHRLEELKALL